MPKLLSKPERAAGNPLPYGRQWIEEDEIEAVARVLRSDWLTTGPAVDAFEADVAAYTGAAHAVAVSSGTAALHAAMHALKVGPGDEVIVPAMTFAATANAVVYCGATPVFADVEPSTLCIDPASVAALVTSRTRAVVAVDYAGQPCDYDALRRITERHGLVLVADSCHALGAEYGGRKVGVVADLTVFSFHPVKHITTGEGGMVVTDDAAWAKRMRVFRNHGISTDRRQRSQSGAWFYEMEELGYNYRISDFQCALGSAQLGKIEARLAQRVKLASRYARHFSGVAAVTPLALRGGRRHAWHLYTVGLGTGRDAVFRQMRENGIGVQVHYIPVHLHPYYRRTLGTSPGLCPVAEAAYERILSLPLFPRMREEDADRVAETLLEVAG